MTHTWRLPGLVACAGLILLVAPLHLLGQRATFQSRTELVRVDVRVSLNGRPVAGLRAEDFELLDNGVRQEIRLVGEDALPMALVAALDRSGSVRGDRLERLQKAVNELFGSLRHDDQATLLTFSDVVTIPASRGTSVPDLLVPSPGPSPGRLTTLRDAAYSALLLADERDRRPLVVLFSDGFDTASWLSADQVLQTARRRHAVVYAVTTGPTPPFLERLAATTGGRMVEARWDESLSAAFRQVLDDFRVRYVLGYVPAGTPQAGWHVLQVRTKNPNITVEAREGYYRESPDKRD